MSDREKVINMICETHKLNKNVVEQVLLSKSEFLKLISNAMAKESRITLNNFIYYYVVIYSTKTNQNVIYFSSF